LGNAGTLTVGTQLAYTVAQSIIVVYDANNFQECEVTAYNPATGSLSFAAPTRTAGGGTYSAWSVNLDGASGGDGSSGTSGTSATAGTSGSTGTSGSSGSSGSSGTSGSSGSAGTAGTSGRNGIDGTSGASIANWYGAFTSTATQVVTAANTPTAITYTNDELSNGIVYSGSQLTVQHTGIYEIAYSLQIEHTGGGGANVDIWLRKNGANIIRTDSILGLRSQSAKQLPFVSIIDSANANDYYEVYFQANASDVQITAVVATGTIPAAPSIITNIKQIGIAVGTTSGTSGSSGSSGSSGINGSSGNTGSSGSAGSSGSSGTSGVDGSTGSSGSAGSSGSSGSSGTTGTSGSSATSGTSGTSGSAGSSGSSGTTGTSGTSATSGSTGTSGSSGTSGNATTSARAVQTFTSTSGQTTFTVTNGYNLGMVDVFVNGVKFVNGTDFTATDGTTVVMAAGLAAGNIVEIDNLLTAYLPTNALRTITTFTATAGQSAFSVSYTQGLIDVFYNGSCLAQTEYIAINGTSVTLVTACQVNDIVVVYAYSYSVGAYSGIGGSGTTNYLSKFTSSSAIGDSSIQEGTYSIGFGITPNATNSSYKLFQFGSSYSLTTFASGIGSFYLGNNAYLSSALNWTRINTGFASDYYQENGKHAWRTAASGSAGSTFSYTQVMTLDASGNLGIGITSGTGKVFVKQTTANFYDGINCYTSANDSFTGIGHTGSVGSVFSSYNSTAGAYTPLAFFTSDLERMRITSAGGVYFGTTGGINGNINYEFRASNSNGGVAILSAYNTSTFASSPSISCYKGSSDTSSANRFIQFYCNGESQPMGGIVGNGATNVQFASISDIREKENIVSIYDSLNKILALNPVEFDWINTGEHIKAGFVAQQVEEIFPEYVVENMSNDGEEERKGLTGGMSSGIIAHLVKAIQEMNTKIIQLEKLVATK
jgi:hypothetical protein